MMKTQLAVLAFVLLPNAAWAQSDLEKIGRFLQGVQQYQQQQNQRSQGNGNNAPAQAPMQGSDPNSSGNQNRGDFNRNGFFPTQPGNRYNQNQYNQNQSPQYRSSQPQRSTPVPQRTYSNQPIVITCDSLSGGVCEYKLVTATNRAYSYKITSGQVQRLKENTDWAVMYKPTSANSWKTYNLRGGKDYEFRQQNGRWQLYMLQ